MTLTDEEISDAQATLKELQHEHRDLNQIIEYLARLPAHEIDQLLVQRLKKKKLLLKDQIDMIERMLVPDIPA